MMAQCRTHRATPGFHSQSYARSRLTVEVTVASPTRRVSFLDFRQVAVRIQLIPLPSDHRDQREIPLLQLFVERMPPPMIEIQPERHHPPSNINLRPHTPPPRFGSHRSATTNERKVMRQPRPARDY